MPQKHFLSALFVAGLALGQADSALAQADSVNFTARAVGGADIRQIVWDNAPPPTLPTTAAWMARAAGKHFGVHLPGSVPGTDSFVVIEFHHDGHHATVREFGANHFQIGGAVLAHWSGLYNGSFRLQLTPAGVEINTRGALNTPGDGNFSVKHPERGLIPADYLIHRPGGWLATHEVF